VTSANLPLLIEDEVVMVFPPIVMLAIFWLVGSAIIGLLGTRKMFGPWGYFFASLILSPVLGALLVATADDRVPPPGT
jgi:hypothetical protein